MFSLLKDELITKPVSEPLSFLEVRQVTDFVLVLHMNLDTLYSIKLSLSRWPPKATSTRLRIKPISLPQNF
jgi:hypothetical protein